MSTVSITVEVHCARSENSPIYRIYVDEDLLTERNWIWRAYDTYVCEHIEVDLGPGTHVLSLVDCSVVPVFSIKNITVNGQPNTGPVFTV
jgi:hypothetical protein